jgi:hypothetical protein
MTNKLIVRLSNELGNQMFMYASALGISHKLKRELLIDNETAFLSRKNISRYGLNNFNINSSVANNKYKFLGNYGYIKRKILKKIDYFNHNKKFYIEHRDGDKITDYNEDFLHLNLSKNTYLEGYFETEKYFIDIKNIINNEFIFNNLDNFMQSPFYKLLNQDNAVAICLRQNRFSEGVNQNNITSNNLLSVTYTKEQIKYVNNSIEFFKNKITNPIFYLWSNDLSTIDTSNFIEKINLVKHPMEFTINIDQRALDLFLISQSKNHIVIPSSFNWWGAWLSKKKGKIILRPSNSFFSTFRINNKNLWPNEWFKIDPS